VAAQAQQILGAGLGGGGGVGVGDDDRFVGVVVILGRRDLVDAVDVDRAGLLPLGLEDPEFAV
jgi:hypothetical protein